MLSRRHTSGRVRQKDTVARMGPLRSEAVVNKTLKLKGDAHKSTVNCKIHALLKSIRPDYIITAPTKIIIK